MADGPNKIKLTRYLSGAREHAIRNAGDDWRTKGETLQMVSDALEKRGPALAEKLGKDSQTAAKLRESLLQSAAHMRSQGVKLKEAGQALDEVSGIVEIARVERETMTNLSEPPPYKETPPAGSQPTPEEITKAANERAASTSEHAAYQAAFDAQEAAAAKTLTKMDMAFLSAIPPMMAIHGGPDPTAPAPSGPGGPGGPGLQAPPTSGSGSGTTGTGRVWEERGGVFEPRDEERDRDRQAERDRQEEKERRAEAEQRERERQERLRQEELERLERERLERERNLNPVTPRTITNVPGSTDSGSTYQGVPSPTASGGAGSASGVGPIGGGAAAGAAGVGVGAGMMGGGSGGGSSQLKAGSVRGIGAGGSAPAPGALTRGATPAGGMAGRAGAPSSASASSARASAAGSAGRGAATGSPSQAGSRGAAAGSTSRSTGAGGRAGAAGASKSSARGGGSGVGSTSGKSQGKGKGLFRRGASGSTAGGRSGNRAKDESTTSADSLVYEQDWLSDDSAAPGVLD